MLRINEKGARNYNFYRKVLGISASVRPPTPLRGDGLRA